MDNKKEDLKPPVSIVVPKEAISFPDKEELVRKLQELRAAKSRNT